MDLGTGLKRVGMKFLETKYLYSMYWAVSYLFLMGAATQLYYLHITYISAYFTFFFVLRLFGVAVL